VKADAYRYASKGDYSPEIDMLYKIDRFGLEAITGRRLFYFGELQRLIVAENIVTAYKSRPKDNWADWANDNPRMEKILIEAELLCLQQTPS
jgi:hypothetical protein